MRKYHCLLLLAMFSVAGFAQGYELGIVNVSGNNFKVVAIPDFTSTGNTDISDVSFTLALPAGATDVVNPISAFQDRSWTIEDQYDAAFLSGAGLGDGTRDLFQIFVPAGQTLLSHTAGQQIDLVSFDITGFPATGVMEFLSNDDPIVTGAGGIFIKFYNTNIDGIGGDPTDDYYIGLAAGMENFSFAILGLEDDVISSSEISIYPNPATNFINIKTSLQIEAVEMFDLLGKQVLRTTTFSERIQVSELPVGAYMLKVYSDKGEFTKKIIIE